MYVHGSRGFKNKVRYLQGEGYRVELERRCVVKRIVVFYDEECDRILALVRSGQGVKDKGDQVESARKWQ